MINTISDLEILEIQKRLEKKLQAEHNIHPLVERVINVAKSKLELLPSLRELTKYDLIFIGKQGCGKTTSILNLTGLLNIDESNNEHIGKTINELSILQTGSGGTTAPEVIITQIESNMESKIVIQKCSLEELKVFVLSYISPLIDKILKTYKGDTPRLSREYCRIIEGMCENVINNHTLNYNEKYKDKEKSHSLLPYVVEDLIKDSLKDLLGETEKPLHIEENLRESLEKKISDILIVEFMLIDVDNYLESREITYDKINHFNKWLKETFKSINNGTFKDSSIPLKVKILISISDLNMNLKDKEYEFSTIIDTRGFRPTTKDKDGSIITMGDGTERKDLIEYMQFNKNEVLEKGKICILTSRYIDCTEGNNTVLSEIILNYADISSEYQNGLNTILVNWCESEPAESADADGRSDEEMIEFRINEIKKFYQNSKGYIFNSDNVFEYNPFAGYDLKKNGKIINYDSIHVKNNRERFFKYLIELINKEKEYLNEQIENSYKVINNFIQEDSFELGNNSGEIIAGLIDEIDIIMDAFEKEIKRHNFASGYIYELENFGSRSYKYIALKGGIHTGVNGKESIYDIVNKINKETFQLAINEAANMILSKFDSSIKICNAATDGENLSRSLSELKTFIRDMFKQMEDFSCNNNRITQIVKNAFLPTDQFWLKVKELARIGGTGVNEKIKKEFIEHTKLKAGFPTALDLNERTQKQIDESLSMTRKKIRDLFISEIK